jgi:molybdenum cofactor sulfurtransferase
VLHEPILVVIGETCSQLSSIAVQSHPYWCRSTPSRTLVPNMGFFAATKISRTMEKSEERRLEYNDRIAHFRKLEYPMLKGKRPSSAPLYQSQGDIGVTYLDHGGTTLASRSLLKSFGKEMRKNLLANPHSDALNPSVSSTIVAEARLEVLQMFNADPDQFDVVFTANATASVKLVMECFSGLDQGFDYCYHRNCHTSLVGVREVANHTRCFASDEETEKWLAHEYNHANGTSDDRPTLFAYPAQSNMNGQRLPLQWSHQLRKSGHHPNTYTLLDVAAYVSTTALDLSDHISAPDFTVLSFYKIFGFPDLGALIVRKASSHILEHRRYFGGGTTEMTTCFGETPWVARKKACLHMQLEDGTIAIRSILALRCAIANHKKLFGDMQDVSKHTNWLSKSLYDRLSILKHANGVSVCQLYKAPTSSFGDPTTQGATIAFNIRRSNGLWTSPYAVGAMLRERNIHIRTGTLCNPGGIASALELSPADLRTAFDEGFRCNHQGDVRRDGILFGMVRVTFGAMSTMEDVEIFANFVERRLVDRGLHMDKSTILAEAAAESDEGMTTPSLGEGFEKSTGKGYMKHWGIFKSLRAVMSGSRCVLGKYERSVI